MISVPLARLGVQIVSTIGVSKVVRDVVRTTAINRGTADKVATKIGELVIGAMVTQKASKFVDGQIDSALAWYANRNTDQTDLKVE